MLKNKVFSKVLKGTLALVLLLLCLLSLVACKGTPILLEESFQVLANAEHECENANVTGYSLKGSLENINVNDENEIRINANTNLKYYANGANKICDVSQSVKIYSKSNGAVSGESNSSLTLNYKSSKIGDMWYQYNESKRLYKEINEEIFKELTDIFSNLEIISSDDIQVKDTENLKCSVNTDLKKLNDKDYNLTFNVTTEQKILINDNMNIRTVNEKYYYEIRNNKITKYENVIETKENNKLMASTKTYIQIDYNVSEIKGIQSLEGYEKGSFSIL